MNEVAKAADASALRIEQAIERLDYRPNQMARGLKRGRTRLIGMLVADILNPYSVAVMHGVEIACRQHGYSLMVCNTDPGTEQEIHHLAALRSYNVEGLIVSTLGHHAGELQSLHSEPPMVLVDRKVEALEVDLVGLDNRDAVRQALDHLQQRGCRDLLLVSEPARARSASRPSGPRSPGAPAQGPGAADRRRLRRCPAGLPRRPRPKALFAANGVAALAATRQLRELGCRLFEEIGLIALDWYPLVGSGITALIQPTERIGTAALECLLDRLQGRLDAGSPGRFQGSTDRQRFHPPPRLTVRRQFVGAFG